MSQTLHHDTLIWLNKRIYREVLSLTLSLLQRPSKTLLKGRISDAMLKSFSSKHTILSATFTQNGTNMDNLRRKKKQKQKGLLESFKKSNVSGITSGLWHHVAGSALKSTFSERSWLIVATETKQSKRAERNMNERLRRTECVFKSSVWFSSQGNHLLAFFI